MWEYNNASLASGEMLMRKLVNEMNNCKPLTDFPAKSIFPFLLLNHAKKLFRSPMTQCTFRKQVYYLNTNFLFLDVQHHYL